MTNHLQTNPINCPSFIIIGSTKAGTTSLYNYFDQHPQICMSAIKEPHFFAFENMHPNFKGPGAKEFNDQIVTSIESYKQLYNQNTNCRACGEASAMYIYYKQSAHNIKKYLSNNVKLIIILRNPVERAYSSYLHLIRDGLEDCTSFRKALEKEDERMKKNWIPLFYYKRLGEYTEQIENYYNVIGRDNIKILLFDDFVKNPYKLYTDLCSFIDVDTSFKPDFRKQYNISGIPKNKILHKIYLAFRNDTFLLKKIKHLFPELLKQTIIKKNLQKLPIEDDDKNYLSLHYKDNILNLQELTGVDFASWLTKS